MLASKATTAARTAARRSFATVADASGVKVAAIDNGQPTSAVTFLVKGGSRFETKPGVAHALKNFAFKSTEKRSALGSIREAELYGGVLSSSLSREHLALTAEFLRGDEAYFVDLLASFVKSARFTRHEFSEYVTPATTSDTLAAEADPSTAALELAHALAFRSGLGASLFASEHNSVTAEDVKAFASSAFAHSNIAVLGTGISQEKLASLVTKALGQASSSASSASASISSPASAYFGGETRHASHSGPQTVFIGYGVSGASPALSALAAHLSPSPSIKWSQGTSPLSGLSASVETVVLPYSDATLFGFLIKGETAESVKEAGQAAVKALKEAKELKDDALKTAIAKAKFEAASKLESREGLVAALGSKVLAGADASVESALSSFDSVNAQAYSQAVSSLLQAKPTFVAVGDIKTLPYADELGL